MKQNIAKVLALSLLATSASFTSCVDNEKNLFNADQLRQIYEETFPVKNINPDGDWTMSRSVTAHVSVVGDVGVDYPIQIFDANPLVPGSNAKLLAEGAVNQSTSFDVVMDCATALEKVFVARVDKKKHYLVQPVTIQNGEVTAYFGDKDTSGRSASRSVTMGIPAMEAPYTAEFISGKKADATVVQSDWDLGAGSGWNGNYNQYPVFGQSERWFMIEEGKTLKAGFKTSGTSGGAQAVKVIIPNGSTWVINNSIQFDNITEIIVEDGGEIEIDDDASLILTAASYMTVLKGGSIKGDGDIRITNGSAGCKNYNAGKIDCSVLDFNGGVGEFYNYGKLELDKYSASTNGMVLVNHGFIKADAIEGNNNTSIKNGCHIEVEDKFQFGELLMGHTSEAICGELSRNGSNGKIEMEEQSMLVCEKADLCKYIFGPTVGKALLKIDKIIGNILELPYSDFKITNNIICEIKDQTSHGTAQWEWSAFDWLVNKGLQNSATYCNPGKADFMLPEGDCIEEGYDSDDEEDNVEIRKAVYSYAFEDNYPKAGDYDFNDIVLNVTLPAAGNKVKELKYTVDLRAVGAVKQLGVGLRILGINRSNVEAVDFGAGATQRAGSLSASRIFENASYETNGSELVIPLFGDAHYVYGYTGAQRPMLNTGNANSLIDIYTLEVTVKLKNAVSIPSVTNNLDFFIAYQGTGEKRTEVHLNQFNSATANGQLADSNVLEVIKAVNNTWALCVPDKFAYPTERTVITEAYGHFAGWAHDQSTNTDWYSTPSSNDKVIKY